MLQAGQERIGLLMAKALADLILRRRVEPEHARYLPTYGQAPALDGSEHAQRPDGSITTPGGALAHPPASAPLRTRQPGPAAGDRCRDRELTYS